MRGLKYQMKSVLKDKFCLMTFLLPIVIAVALNFMGSIDLSSLGGTPLRRTGKRPVPGDDHMAGAVRPGDIL